MATNLPNATTIAAGTPYYRITSPAFRTKSATQHAKVVDGQGARLNRGGGRYNHGGVVTVYLAETIEACLAERMYYFHRDVLRKLDLLHINPGGAPVFAQRLVLWEVIFKTDVQPIADLTPATASYFGVFPSLMLNPSQDYYHLKDRRTYVESSGFQGLRAPSSRSTQKVNMVVLFADQSKNLRRITPYDVELRLITPGPGSRPFTNHAIELLDFTAGEVQIAGRPGGVQTYNSFARLAFNH